MFTQIGEKIKTLAAVICWLGIIGSVIGGIALIENGEVNIAIGILVMLGGALVSWLGSFFTYGFGELVSNSELIAQNHVNHTDNIVSKENIPQTDEERLQSLNELFKSGLITKDEYETAKSRINEKKG